MNVFPDFGAVGASGEFASVIGALLTIVLIGAVFTLLTSAMGLAVSTLFQGMWEVFSTTTSVDVTSDGYVKLINVTAAPHSTCLLYTSEAETVWSTYSNYSI